MRKIITYTHLLLVSFISLDCSITQEQFEKSHWDEKIQGPLPTFKEFRIETLEVSMLPDSGAYYIYQPQHYNDKIINIENKLRRLYALGINITMAWYRPPHGGCQIPGLITRTIYPEFLLIRLSEPNNLLEDYNFRKIEKISSLPCPYDISYYLPEFKNDSVLFDNH